jgi:hypothetical protein
MGVVVGRRGGSRSLMPMHSTSNHQVHPQREERHAMKLIAQIPGWRLYDRPTPGEGWINYKLASGKLPKHTWWLGFNGTRMARNREPRSSNSTNPISTRVVRSLSGLARHTDLA